MKIRLWGTEDECRAVAERLAATPGLAVLSVSEPYADRGASVLVRVYIEARLDAPTATVHATAERVTRRRALPPGGAR